MKRFNWSKVIGIFLCIILGFSGLLKAESLLRIENGGIFVDAPDGVDITLTCGQWGPSEEGSASIYLHQGPYLDYTGYEIRAFNNVIPGVQANFYYFQQDREIVLVLLDHTTQIRYYTGPAQRNPDNQVHALIEGIPGDENTYLVRFEHSPYGGDDNFTDTQFTITATKALSNVSEDPGIINMGINIGTSVYFSTQWLFVDIMKKAMPWVTQNSYTVSGGENPWDTGVLDQIPRDENGYPLELPYEVPGTEATQIVTTLLERVDGNYPPGIYTVYYEGEGDLYIGFDAHVIHSEPGKIQVEVTPSTSGIIMKIMRSVAGNHIRNIRVIMPGFEDSYEEQVFHPLFLEKFKDLNALRFMVPAQTNDNPVSAWEDRTMPTYYTQGDERGVALEYLIELANRMNKDAWFCVPHMADDDYVRNMARLVRDTLDPGLKVYIEYSNEVWNGIFSQAPYTRDMGCQLQLWGDCSEGGNAFWSGIFYYALRTAEVFKIFDEEFANNDNLVKVISTQTANSYVTQQLLEKFHDQEFNPYGVTADALGITGYFGTTADLIATYGEVDTITVDEILDRTQDSITRTVQYIVNNKTLADQYGLKMIAYEGGQHLVATGANVNDNTLTEKLIAANRHPRMKDIYDTMFDAWFNYGGDVFMVFSSVCNPGKYGSWGILEYMDQPVAEAPKYLSVSQYTQRNRIPVFVHTSAGSPYHGLAVSAYTDSGDYTGNHTITGEDGVAYFNPDDFQEGSYKFSVDYQGYEFWSEVVAPVMGEVIDVVIDHETAEIMISTASGPAQDTHVCVFTANGTETGICGTTDADGMVSFELPVGSIYSFAADILGNTYTSDLYTISSGTTNDISINTGGGILRINVRKADGSPIQGYNVRLCNAAASYLGLSESTDAGGSVGFDVPEGSYMSVLDYLGQEFSSEEIFVSSDSAVDLVIAHQDVEITVREVFQGVYESIEGINIELCTSGGDELGIGTLTDASGKAFFSLPERPFKVKVSYLGQEFFSEEFTWQNSIIDIPLAEARITLTWNNSQPLEGGIVSVLSATGDDLGISGTTDDQGIVVFRLPAGDYIFNAESYGSCYQSTVETLLNDEINIISIQTGAAFTLSVMKAPDKPLRGVECTLLDGQGNDLGLTFNTDINHQVIFNLPHGSYLFRVDYLGEYFISEAVSVPETCEYSFTILALELFPSLGVNLSGFGYTSRQLMFSDVMHGSMPWVTQNSYSVAGGVNPFNTGVIDQIPLDENGYPLELPYEVAGTEAPQIVFTFMLYTLVDEYPAGLYTMYYDGVGTFAFTGDVTIVSQEPGKIGIQVGPHVYGIGMKILSSEASNHVRNIRMIMPDYAASYEDEIFYSSFTDRLQAFDVLRFNDVARTQSNARTAWDQRAIPTYYTQCTQNGVALEYLIEMANRTQKDPWFSVPYGVDDAYVQNMAELIRNNLDSDRNVYLEYYSDDFSLRHAQIFNIFEQVFGGDERLIEIVKSRSPLNAQVDMERSNNPAYNPYGITIEAIAVKAYFGENICSEITANNEVDTITVDEILDRAEASVFGEFLQEIKAYHAVAEQYNVGIFAYEGGQSLVVSGNDVLFAKFTQANRHPRMEDLYTCMFDVWFNNGGDLFELYSYVQNPYSGRNWGVLEYQDQPIEEAPKYLSVMNYVQAFANQAPTAYDLAVVTEEDCPVPMILNASDPEDSSLMYGIISSPVYGTLSGEMPDVTYTPNPDFNGTDSFTYMAGDGELDSNTATVSITVNPVNDTPVAQAGPDQVVVAGADRLTGVTLDGSASYDPDNESLTYQWTWPGGSANGVTPSVMLPVGTTSVELQVNDGLILSDPDIVSITIIDETPPEMSVTVNPGILWPPNHKMVLVTPAVTTSDNCDPAPDIQLSLITMNEGDVVNTYDPNYDITVEDGNTAGDILVDSDGNIYLRAERQGSGSGRTYTFTFEATDLSGNTSTGTATVTVPHNL